MSARRSCTPLDTFTGLTVLFYVGAHSGSSRNRDNWGWDKIRQPCQISSLLSLLYTYTTIYLTTFKRETTRSWIDTFVLDISIWWYIRIWFAYTSLWSSFSIFNFNHLHWGAPLLVLIFSHPIHKFSIIFLNIHAF